MELEYPGELLNEEQWHGFVRERIPALASAWKQEKYEQYNTLLALHGLSYEEYKRIFLDHISYAPYIPLVRRAMPKLTAQDIIGVQPMCESIGEIFNKKC